MAVSLQRHVSDNATLSVVSASQRAVSGNDVNRLTLLLSYRQGDMSAVISSGPVPCAMLMQTALPACQPQVTGLCNIQKQK